MDYSLKLQQLLVTQQTALQRYNLDDGSRVWVRKLNKGNPRWRYQALNFITKKVFKLPILQAVYINPKQSLQDEARRLQELHHAGVKVPRLFAVNDHGLMMEDLGDLASLAQVLDDHRHDTDKMMHLWQKGATELFTVHLKEQYLSQAFLRNLLYSPDGEIYCIDFEEDPKLVLSLEQCQIRDYLLFLHSSAFYLINDLAIAVDFFVMEISKRPIAIQQEFLATIKALKWINNLSVIKHCGRDGYRTYCTGVFINSLYEKMH